MNNKIQFALPINGKEKQVNNQSKKLKRSSF